MKMSDKGVDSSEIVMLPSLQKGYGYRCRCAPKKLISQGYRCPQCLKLAKKVSFYNIASEDFNIFPCILIHLENSDFCDFWLILKFFGVDFQTVCCLGKVY